MRARSILGSDAFIANVRISQALSQTWQGRRTFPPHPQTCSNCSRNATRWIALLSVWAAAFAPLPPLWLFFSISEGLAVKSGPFPACFFIRDYLWLLHLPFVVLWLRIDHFREDFLCARKTLFAWNSSHPLFSIPQSSLVAALPRCALRVLCGN